MMLGTKELVQDQLATGAEIVAATAILAEQVLPKIIGGGPLCRLALKLLGNSLSDEIR
jgi:hypothetical protein